jgi:hypothetical protein
MRCIVGNLLIFTMLVVLHVAYISHRLIGVATGDE